MCGWRHGMVEEDGAFIGKRDGEDAEVKCGKSEKKKEQSLGQMKDWREKIKGGGQERWNMGMWRKLLGAALLWQANWSSVWQRTLSCHSNEEPICCILQAVCWILMMLQKAQTTDRHCVTKTPLTLSLSCMGTHSTYPIPLPSSPQIICNRVRGILNTSSDCKAQHVNMNYFVRFCKFVEQSHAW